MMITLDIATAEQLPPRPSHPTPPSPLDYTDTSSVANDLYSPAYPHRAFRPKLRIITSSPPPVTRPILRKPVPIYPPGLAHFDYPGLVKSAPLFYPITYIDSSLIGHVSTRPKGISGGLVVQIHSPEASHQVHVNAPAIFRPTAAQRKRRFSEKCKDLFTHLTHRHPGKPPDDPFQDSLPTSPTPPKRPPRSPGTASFLVHRQLPSLPCSPDHSFGAVTTDYLAPPGIEISHFSNPTTCSSGAEGSARSISDSELLSVKSGTSRASVRVREGRVLDKWEGGKWGSMPDLRGLVGVWSEDIGTAK